MAGFQQRLDHPDLPRPDGQVEGGVVLGVSGEHGDRALRSSRGREGPLLPLAPAALADRGLLGGMSRTHRVHYSLDQRRPAPPHDLVEDRLPLLPLLILLQLLQAAGVGAVATLQHKLGGEGTLSGHCGRQRCNLNSGEGQAKMLQEAHVQGAIEADTPRKKAALREQMAKDSRTQSVNAQIAGSLGFGSRKNKRDCTDDEKVTPAPQVR